MKKETLTPAQMIAANNLDKTIKNLSNIGEILKQYKLGDIFILEEWDHYNPKNVVVQETTLGFPKKFQVVYISAVGIPYLRQLTAKGNPTGETLVPPESAALNTLKNFYNPALGNNINWRFTPDPEQMDAILLQTEFDPMAQQKEKSKLYNEINKHNKNVAIPTGWNDFNKIADFFKNLNPGDKFWTAPDKQYVIQSITKPGREYEIKCTDQNQKEVVFNISHFQFRRLYKEQPRSFSKEAAK